MWFCSHTHDLAIFINATVQVICMCNSALKLQCGVTESSVRHLLIMCDASHICAEPKILFLTFFIIPRYPMSSVFLSSFHGLFFASYSLCSNYLNYILDI
jgi:hypothetical protein